MRLPWRKVSTVRELAERLSDGRLDPDVLATLRNAIRATYRLDHLPTEDEVLVIAEKWRPYRSLAICYLFSAAFEEAQGLAAQRSGQ